VHVQSLSESTKPFRTQNKTLIPATRTTITNILNLGSGTGYLVTEITVAARKALDRPEFWPGVMPRRAGDPAVLIASSEKAGRILGWSPSRSLTDIIADAAEWQRSDLYRNTVLAKVT
jgi:UDP-glucose 4-epimerase